MYEAKRIADALERIAFALEAQRESCVTSIAPEALSKEDAAEVVLQVNGKVRGKIFVPFGGTQEALEKAALADPKVRVFVEGKQVVKVIVVPDKLVNIVVR